MKQGTGKSTVSGGKVEPTSRGINPAHAASIGIQEVRTRPLQVYAGRGIEAPMAACTVHPKGSQGKTK